MSSYDGSLPEAALLLSQAWDHVSPDAVHRLHAFRTAFGNYDPNTDDCTTWEQDLEWAMGDEEWAVAIMVAKLGASDESR